MKKLFAFFVVVVGFLLAPNAFAEQITQFDATISIRSDAAIEVTERIVYDFGDEDRHGIFRIIPISYKARGGNFSLRISDISVTDEKGTPHQFTISYPSRNIEIKIGDPDVLITGQHTYTIAYIIRRAINYFEDHDELYWNVTGNDWQVPIGSASAKVTVPQKMESADIQVDCFSGEFGSTQKCGSIIKNAGTIDSVSFHQDQLSSGDGLTIVVGVPKGIIYQPTPLEAALETAKDNWVVVVPVFMFAICFYLWYKRGRDPKGRGVIIAQYEAPDDLTPAEVGTIVDEKAQNKDMSAEIIFLATKGYLKIKQMETKVFLFTTKDYEMTILKNDFGALNEYQKILMEGMQKEAANGTVKLSDLKNKFYKDLAKAIEKTYEAVVQKGYFVTNPRKTQIVYVVIGAIVSVLGVIFGEFWGGIGVASLIVSGLIVIFFGMIMPARTRKGVEAKEYILGLKLYMSVAEKRRLEFHNAPEKKPEQFEKLLPYAMALGVEKEWAKQFEGIYTQNPGWYEGAPGTVFHAAMFAGALSDFSSSASTAMSTSPGGGSGFSGGGSGGGGGGGGGGSW